MELPKQTCECAFHIKGNVCASDEVIKQLQQLLKEQFGINVSAKDKAKTIEAAKEVTNCSTEACVLQKPAIVSGLGRDTVEKELETRFKPEGPLGYTELLNNFNIDEVLDQMTKAFKGFYHIPFQMIDFAEQARTDSDGVRTGSFARDRNLATIDIIKKYKEGYRQFGVVLNTDYSSGPGKHWFCIFIDMKSKPFTIEYFNSSGNMPLVQVSAWMIDTKMKLSELGPTEVVRVATERLQEDDYSCGVWSLYYIVSRLNGVEPDAFKSSRLNDDLMYSFRKYFFRR